MYTLIGIHIYTRPPVNLVLEIKGAMLIMKQLNQQVKISHMKTPDPENRTVNSPWGYKDF